MGRLPVKGTNKEIRKLIQHADKAGWRMELSRSGHIKCFSPNGKTIVVLPVTTKNLRAVNNAKSGFKKAGLAI